MENDVILKTNPQIDTAVTSDYERLANQLRRLGVDLSTRYSLEPPLGDTTAFPSRLRAVAKAESSSPTSPTRNCG